MIVLAIDGGGTKTSAVICDELGNVYAKVVTSRSNPTAMGIPILSQRFMIYYKICNNKIRKYLLL